MAWVADITSPGGMLGQLTSTQALSTRGLPNITAQKLAIVGQKVWFSTPILRGLLQASSLISWPLPDLQDHQTNSSLASLDHEFSSHFPSFQHHTHRNQLIDPSLQPTSSTPAPL